MASDSWYIPSLSRAMASIYGSQSSAQFKEVDPDKQLQIHNGVYMAVNSDTQQQINGGKYTVVNIQGLIHSGKYTPVYI
jgi:hypothetical protein